MPSYEMDVITSADKCGEIDSWLTYGQIPTQRLQILLTVPSTAQ